MSTKFEVFFLIYNSIVGAGPALPLGNCLRPPSPKILEKNRVVEEFQMNYKNNLNKIIDQKSTDKLQIRSKRLTTKQSQIKTLKILPFSLVSNLHCSVCPQPLSDSLLSASLKSQLLTSSYQESGIKL